MSSHTLSDYELIRSQNIERNEEFLKMLGLDITVDYPVEIEKHHSGVLTNQSNRFTLDALSSRNIEVILDGDGISRKPITNKSLREYITTTDPVHNDEISDAAIRLCVDRIHTMSNKQLAL